MWIRLLTLEDPVSLVPILNSHGWYGQVVHRPSLGYILFFINRCVGALSYEDVGCLVSILNRGYRY